MIGKLKLRTKNNLLTKQTPCFMKNTYFLLFIIISLIVYSGCKKKEEKPNQKPGCEITAPYNGQEIKKGETVTISVDAVDKDGTISEVRFFVDGVGKSSVKNFPYNYEWNTLNENEGNHIIKATSIDNEGAASSDDIAVTIIAGGSAPVAAFSADKTHGTKPFRVYFTDESTNDPTSWHWDFGDGNTSAQKNPEHTYSVAGTFNVSLTVTNDYGSNTKSKDGLIVVEEQSAPEADFTATPTSGTVPLTVNFTDESINNPTSWYWDFGDGTASYLQNPSHTYDVNGTFSVTLTVSNTYGYDTKTKTEYINVESDTGVFTDARDGQEYTYVVIGNQIWMAENLKYLPSVSSPETGSYTEPYYYVYDYFGNNVSQAKNTYNYKTYGVLYNWTAATDACPAGSHLPTANEWKTLEMYLGMSQSDADATEWRGSDQGEKMKSTSGWYDNGNGTNSSGFNALPGGSCDGLGNFYYIEYTG